MHGSDVIETSDIGLHASIKGSICSVKRQVKRQLNASLKKATSTTKLQICCKSDST